MQIIIDIDETLYEILTNPNKFATMQTANRVCEAVENGIVLPKRHGRLIDADEVNDAIYKCFEGIQCYDGTGYDIYSDSKEDIDKIPTIIDADKESEEI